MKAKLAALVATPLMGLSSLAFAQNDLPSEQSTLQEPLVLSQTQMDGVTAGSLVYLKTGDINVVKDVTIKDNVQDINSNIAVLQFANFQK